MLRIVVGYYVTDVIDCASSPCVMGSCLETTEGFICMCETGYTGDLCDQGMYTSINVDSKCNSNLTHSTKLNFFAHSCLCILSYLKTLSIFYTIVG